MSQGRILTCIEGPESQFLVLEEKIRENRLCSTIYYIVLYITIQYDIVLYSTISYYIVLYGATWGKI